MGQLMLFDYDQLDVETRIVVQQRTDEIRELVRKTAQDIVDIGAKLTEVKNRLGHGHFGAWLDGEFGWTDRTAQRFMSVAERFKADNLSDVRIAPSALYLLAAPSTPEEAREEALARAEEGETISHSAAKEIVREHRPEPPSMPARPAPVVRPTSTTRSPAPSRPARPAAPARPAPPPRPAPVMVENPRPRVEPDVVVSIRIGPGVELLDRPVTVGIGREGEFPRLSKGVYGGLRLLVGAVLAEWFVVGDEELAEAEVIAEA